MGSRKKKRAAETSNWSAEAFLALFYNAFVETFNTLSNEEQERVRGTADHLIKTGGKDFLKLPQTVIITESLHNLAYDHLHETCKRLLAIARRRQEEIVRLRKACAKAADNLALALAGWDASVKTLEEQRRKPSRVAALIPETLEAAPLRSSPSLSAETVSTLARELSLPARSSFLEQLHKLESTGWAEEAGFRILSNEQFKSVADSAKRIASPPATGCSDAAKEAQATIPSLDQLSVETSLLTVEDFSWHPADDGNVEKPAVNSDLTAEAFIVAFYNAFTKAFQTLSEREKDRTLGVVKFLIEMKGKCFIQLPQMVIITESLHNIFEKRRHDAHKQVERVSHETFEVLNASLTLLDQSGAALQRRGACAVAKKQRAEKRREKILELIGAREKPKPGDSAGISQLACEMHSYLKNNEPELVKKGKGIIDVETLRRELVKLLQRDGASKP
jgi:hypothetical protein